MKRLMRGPQWNCQQEPAYYGHETVVFCLRAPDMCAHLKSPVCPIEEPHAIADCLLFNEEANEIHLNISPGPTPGQVRCLVVVMLGWFLLTLFH